MQDSLAKWNETGTPNVAMQWMGEPVPQDAMPGMATPAEMQELAAARGLQLDDLFTALMINHHAGGLHMAEHAAEAARLLRHAQHRRRDGEDAADGDRRAQPRAPGPRTPDPSAQHGVERRDDGVTRHSRPAPPRKSSKPGPRTSFPRSRPRGATTRSRRPRPSSRSRRSGPSTRSRRSTARARTPSIPNPDFQASDLGRWAGTNQDPLGVLRGATRNPYRRGSDVSPP